MTSNPQVAIVIPTHNDELWVASAIQSCLRQSLTDIEIICVDDASTDGTRAIIEQYRADDSRVHLITLTENSTAFHARRVGVLAARAPYLLFLDGDDELAENAARVAVNRAIRTGADIVGFGVDIIMPNGKPAPAFESALQPSHAELHEGDILPMIFPLGETANGHLWRYLFNAATIRNAYAAFQLGLKVPRVNDLPITMVALSMATHYVSTPDRLYKYYFRRGTSGHRVVDLKGFGFYLSAVDSIELVASAFREMARASQMQAVPPRAQAVYESARLSIIGNILRYCAGIANPQLQDECLEHLERRVGRLDMIRAAAGFAPDSLASITRTVGSGPVGVMPGARQRVLVVTNELGIGGLQGVVLSQARYLADSGFTVTVAMHRRGERPQDLPPNVGVVWIEGDHPASKLASWVKILTEAEADIVIDHHILYNRVWPFFALAARSMGIATVGWLHNFSLRPLFDDNINASFLSNNLSLLETVVTLSDVDVAYWKLRGIPRTVRLPNPPSPLLLDFAYQAKPKAAPIGPIRLIWWGRLQQSTKQVRSLVSILAALAERDVAASLTIIGPDSPDLSVGALLKDAEAAGVADRLRLPGPLKGQALVDELQSAHIFVSTSLIEGYLLTLVEAQAFGLPVVMYELPWLMTTVANDGLVAVSQGDVESAAQVIRELASTPERYRAYSTGALAAARKAISHDFSDLYRRLVANELGGEYSPSPSLADAGLLLEWSTRYSERNSSRHRVTERQVSELKKKVAWLRGKVARVPEPLSKRRRYGLVSRGRRWVARGVLGRRGWDYLRSNRPGSPTGEGSPELLPLEEHTSGPPIDVSVVIPVFDAEPWIDECVRSVLAQSGVTVEVLCVNDGSTDRSRGLLTKLSELDGRIRIIDQAHSGRSVARNVGAAAAGGRYVVFLDSEDHWSADGLAGLVRKADAQDLDVMLFDGHAVLDPGGHGEAGARSLTRYPRSAQYGGVRAGSEMIASLQRAKDYRGHAGLYLTRTASLRGISLTFTPGVEHQDDPFTFSLLMNSKRVSHERTDLYAKRFGGVGELSTLQISNSARSYLHSYVAMQREASRHEVPLEVSHLLADVIHCTWLDAAKQFAALPESVSWTLKPLDPSPDAQLAYRSLRSAN